MTKYYNISQVAKLLGYNRCTISVYIKKGLLKAYKVRGLGRKTTRISQEQIDEFLNNSLTTK